jgi:hypothetical protein
MYCSLSMTHALLLGHCFTLELELTILVLIEKFFLIVHPYVQSEGAWR